jgi:hypothetical protein
MSAPTIPRVVPRLGRHGAPRTAAAHPGGSAAPPTPRADRRRDSADRPVPGPVLAGRSRWRVSGSSGSTSAPAWGWCPACSCSAWPRSRSSGAPAARPGGEAADEEGALEQRQVARQRRVRQGEAAGQLRDVQQRGRARGQEVQQAREIAQPPSWPGFRLGASSILLELLAAQLGRPGQQGPGARVTVPPPWWTVAAAVTAAGGPGGSAAARPEPGPSGAPPPPRRRPPPPAPAARRRRGRCRRWR